MLRKISKIKSLGVFGDYTWSSSLPPFERYNVIYGDNGSGKTTLSRLLDCLKDGGHSEYPALEFKLESESGELTHGKKAGRKIRVFNSDYVQQNIGQLDGSLKPILVIGEENKAAVEVLVAAEAELARRKGAISDAERQILAYQNGRGKIFTGIAKLISEATSGSTGRNYRRNNAEAAFSSAANPTALSEPDIQSHKATIRQDAAEVIHIPVRPTANFLGNEVSLADATERLAITARSLSARSATAGAIQRLRDQPDIAHWIEEGHALHKRNGSRDCEFCRQPVPAERWQQLEAHFNTEDQVLKTEIEAAIEAAGALIHALERVTFPDRLALYSDMREQFDVLKSTWLKERDVTLNAIVAVCESLKVKLAARGDAIPFNIDVSVDECLRAFDALKDCLATNNAKTASFTNAKSEARSAVDSHYLASVRGEVKEIDRKIQSEKQRIETLGAGDPGAGVPSLADLEASINSNRGAISNAHKAGDQLTSLLHTFLGRDELVFHSSDDGYRILRRGKSARRLSEGERTAIAFIYFIVQLSDRDFDKSDGIIVVDDPVSSLDANSVYQAFAFLKNAVKDAKQVFLLTHSFGFLRLVLNWLHNIKKTDGKRQFYMLVCRTDSGGRHSSIDKLDSTLVEHPSEYHFLFKILSSFRSDGTIAGCYHIPNVVRKVLETFLDFYIPGKKNPYAKLSDVTFDENKKTAIYKFANDLSHFTGQGFEPGLVQESQKNATYLLEMIRELAPQHYNGMVEATTPEGK